jgi:hypothetical protein
MNFNELVKIYRKEIKRETIIHYPEIRDLCSRKYLRHPKGCPNIEKCNESNVPDFATIDEAGDYNHYYLIFARFNFKLYKELRKEEHPDWSDNRIKSVLYWQNSVKKLLKDYIYKLVKDIPKGSFYIFGCGSGFIDKRLTGIQKTIASMEYCYINVFSTLKLNKIPFEIRPENIVTLVCLVCSIGPIRNSTQVLIA